MSALDIPCLSCGAAPGEACREHISADLLSLKKHGKTKRDRKALTDSLVARREPHESRVIAARKERRA